MLKRVHMFCSKRGRKGFTLIELLIVVAIIAILAAIAIPQFAAYRKKGYNASANSDLRNIRTSEEAMMADYQDYGCSDTTDNTGGNNAGMLNAAAGAQFWLVGAMTTSKPNLKVSPSPSVWGIVKVNGVIATSKSTVYLGATAHNNGDQYYAAGSGSTILMRKGFTAVPGVTPNDIAGYVSTPVVGDPTTELTGGNWISIQ